MFGTGKSEQNVWGSDAPAAFASEVPADASRAQIKKYDEEQQLVYGEVYAPGFPDSQGDFMTRESIQKMAHEFLRKGLVNKIDLHHSEIDSGCYVVESFIAQESDQVFIPGSWVLGVKVPDRSTWSLVKSGQLNGFSLDGQGVRVDTDFEIEMPETISGETEEAAGHKNAGKVIVNSRKKFVAKKGTIQLLTTLAKKRGGLKYATFDVSRTGDKEPAVGDVFDYTEKAANASQLAKKYDLKPEDVEAANYEEEITYRSPEQLLELGVGKMQTGVGYDGKGGTSKPNFKDEL